jgi:5'-3' exonuclease
LAIAGDKVDNIPGIPGIGMTIAGRLLTKFDTLQNLRQNLDQVKEMKFRGAERIMNLLKEHESILDISAQLTPINCAVESMQQVGIQRTKVDVKKLQEMMAEQNLGQNRVQKWLQLIESWS